MRFMVIGKATKDSEQGGALPDPQLMADMNKFIDELVRAGVLLGYEGLHPSSKGARVHFSGKNRTVTDGPFAETKELIAGFMLWQVKSLEEAIEWVKRSPNPRRRIRGRDPPGLRARRLCIRLLRRRYSAGKRNPRSTGRSGSKEIAPLALTHPNPGCFCRAISCKAARQPWHHWAPQQRIICNLE